MFIYRSRTLICSALGLLASTTPVWSQNAPAAEDPFSAPPSAPASPFGESPAPLSPFGSALPAPAAAPVTDPFAGSTGVPSQAENPFDAPAAAPAPTSPFGAAPAGDPFANAGSASTDPFAAPAPSAFNAPSPNPFGASAPAAPAPTVAAQPASPFGDSTAPAPAPAPTGQPASPFGGASAAQPAAPVIAPDENPFAAFGGTENIGSPFGGPSTFSTPPTTATGQPASPFGGQPSTPATAAPAGGTSNPFFGTSSNPESPFGGQPAPATTAQPSAGTSNPFATGPSTFSPFTNNSVGATGAGDTNPDGISALYAFRYETLTRWDGSRFVNRKQLPFEQAKEFDRLAQERYVSLITAGPGFPGYDGTTPPDIWAEWCHYSDQLELWSQYVDDVVLAGTRVEQEPTFKEIQWPGGAQPAANGQQPGSLDGQTNIVNYASSTSLDDQTSDLIFGSPTPGGQQQQPSTLDPSVMTKQVVKVYNDRLADLRNLENSQETFYTDFLERLAERKTRRLAYADWRNDQERNVEDAIIDWNRRYNGSVANIGGVRYELYRPGGVPENVQRDAVVVVTEFDLTPFDILNPEDGTLKE